MGQFVPSRSQIDGDLTFQAADSGIVHAGSGAITQATSLSTTVGVSATSGVITLHASTLGAGAEAEFIVGNTTVKSDSLVFLTVECPLTNTTNATMVAQVLDIGDNMFKIRLSNPGAAGTTTNSHKIHFFVINKS